MQIFSGMFFVFGIDPYYCVFNRKYKEEKSNIETLMILAQQCIVGYYT